MSVFYERFSRRAGGAGLSGQSTHYCPGCGHGLVHKYLADAIERLGVQDRTIVISPVGCAVFLYYYLDVGHVQAAHGRAPAVALAEKLAHPESIVVTYQGDGDLASIGIAEILQVAQMGAPVSVVFVNNAVYGMTGGQMAPTTLLGQRTTTSVEGRSASMGEPLKVSELIAQLDGPVYVERVALYDAKRRRRARLAIETALRLQVEGRGFAFVEVLSECPLHLGLTPKDAERWVREEMTSVFPLGTKKDCRKDRILDCRKEGPKEFDPEVLHRLIGGTTDAAPRFLAADVTPSWGDTLSVKFAGAGGDGAQTAALVLTHAALNEGFDATHIPSYGPESRGGTSYADVQIARDEVLDPAVPSPHVLVAFNAPSLARFGPAVAPDGLVIYDSSVVTESPVLRADVRVLPIPAAAIANDLGCLAVKNIVTLGAVAEATGVLPAASLLTAMRQLLGRKVSASDLNDRAFAAGVDAANAAASPGTHEAVTAEADSLAVGAGQDAAVSV